MTKVNRFMNEAIKLAIEKGGYIEPGALSLQFELYTQDPLFWQALGKVLGWKDYWKTDPEWLQYARQYFDLVLTGGDTEKLWKELLTKATTA